MFFSATRQRNAPSACDWVVYGPGHLFRAAWLAGARDYLKDPWTADELFLRIRGPERPHLSWTSCGLPLALEGRDLVGPEERVTLSTAEAGLLRALTERQGLPVSREVLGWAAWCSDGRVIDTLVGRLRAKLARVSGLRDIQTVESVRRVGYRLP